MKKRFFFFVVCLGVICVFLWLQKTKPQYAKVPIRYKACSTVPLVEMEIESKKYLIELDLGSADYLMLREEILSELQHKQETEPSETIDIHGNQYTRSRFLIPEIKIENFKVHPVSVAQESIQFLINAHIGDGDPDIAQKRVEDVEGRLGIKIFEQACLLLDLPNSVLYIARDINALTQEAACSLSGFVEVPLDSKPEEAVFVFKTDKGEKRFLIDTGTELSFSHDPDPLQKYQFVKMNLFVGESKEERTFITLNLDSFAIDGILGVDFLKKHAVCIDLKNKRALISPPSP